MTTLLILPSHISGVFGFGYEIERFHFILNLIRVKGEIDY